MSIPNYVASGVLLVGGVAAYIRTQSLTSLLVACSFAILVAIAAYLLSSNSHGKQRIGLNLALGTCLKINKITTIMFTIKVTLTQRSCTKSNLVCLPIGAWLVLAGGMLLLLWLWAAK